MPGDVTTLDGAILSPELLAKIDRMGQGVTDLQEVIGMTRYIQSELRRTAYTIPEDRQPETRVIAANFFSVDPAVAGGDMVAGVFQSFATYEVPEHRVGWVLEHSGYVRVITVLGAAQSVAVQVRLTSPTGEVINYRMVPAPLAAAAATQLFLPATAGFRLMPRWKIEVGGTLGAGAGTARCHASLSVLEYNK